MSIPPVTSPAFADSSASSDVSEDSASELEDSFFVRRANADVHAHQAHHEEEHQVDPRTAQKRTAAAHARREHLSRYVKWTVGVAAAVCLLGIGRVALKGKQEFGPPPPIVHTAMASIVDTTPHDIAHDPNSPAQAQAPAPQEESQAAADQAVAALDNQPAPTTAPAAVDPAQAAPAQAAVDPNAQKPADPVAQAPAAAAPVQAAAPVAAAAAAPAAASDKTAAQEKKSASQMLERGNAKGAIEAGERSVALDPADGEAWLVLGAAYQEVGKNADAKRCFNACLKEGKRGPIGECRAMLQ